MLYYLPALINCMVWPWAAVVALVALASYVRQMDPAYSVRALGTVLGAVTALVCVGTLVYELFGVMVDDQDHIPLWFAVADMVVTVSVGFWVTVVFANAFERR